MKFLSGILNGFKFRRLYKILCDQRKLSDAELSQIYNKVELPDDKFFAEETGIEIEFVPALRRFLGNDKHKISAWLDSPIPALYEHTPRHLRSLANGKHAFHQFTGRLSEFG